jgi:hypothetical protein
MATNGGAANATSNATGGVGGVGRSSGDGGAAIASSGATGLTSAATAIATGGSGAIQLSEGGAGGMASTTANSNGGPALATAVGGQGGSSSGGIGGSGGAAVAAATSTTSGSASAAATGGSAGQAYGSAGSGGAATATASAVGGSAIATATGGGGGVGTEANSGNGGQANATAISAAGSASATATGGSGGNGVARGGFSSGANGGLANATSTSTAMQGGIANATGGNGGAATAGCLNCLAGAAGAANATSFAATINGYMAMAQSTAAGPSGQAQATAQTNFGIVNSVQTVATSQVGGTGPANALAQVGGNATLPNAIVPGQSFSVVNTVASVPLTLAFGAMGAGYGGSGSPLTYQQSATFTFNNASGPFLIDMLGNTSLRNGFDSALFQISDNGNVIVSQSFASLASAEAFFSNNNLINIMLAGGLNNVQLAFNETMSSGEGFSFDYAAAGGLSPTPLPPTWTMMLIGLAGLGFAFSREVKGTLGRLSPLSKMSQLRSRVIILVATSRCQGSDQDRSDIDQPRM